jgi:hypothetical protein
MSYHPMIPGPQVAAGAGWDHIGSPEWLDALFPNVHQPPDAKREGDQAQLVPQVAEVRS